MLLLQYLAFEKPALDLDITVVIQLGLFLLVMLALRKYVLVPYFKAYDEREKRTTGAQEEARELQQRAADAKAEYENERQKVYAEVESERRAKLNVANEEANQKIEKARKEIQTDIAARQAAFDEEIAEARRNASPEIDAISSQIASKILV